MSTTNTTVTLRPARRSDIPALARVANAGYANSALHRRIAPHQDKYPLDYYHWRLNIIRQRFTTPELRTIVAFDNTSGEILGQAAWAVEGEDTPLYKRWTGEFGWSDWVEGKVIEAEKLWSRYVADRSVDYAFLDGFMSGFLGEHRVKRPACLHCHMIVVDPTTRSNGVGRLLIDWAKDLAMKEDLPLFLESLVEAVGFYEKSGFLRLGEDAVLSAEGQEPVTIPAFVWEGEGREGRWLERDRDESSDGNGTGEKWRWRDDVLLKT